MICRIWRGWTTPENAPRYEAVLRGEVMPGIVGRAISGFRGYEMMKREIDTGFEFTTIMWFDDIEAVKRFTGEDYEVAHVPEAARAVLSDFDKRSVHYEVFEGNRAL